MEAEKRGETTSNYYKHMDGSVVSAPMEDWSPGLDQATGWPLKY